MHEASAPDTNRRDSIIAAARAVFIHYGFRRTSLDEIARAAGVSRTGLYHYFRNKEQIFRAATEDLHERAQIAAEQAASQPAPLAKRLQAILEAKLGWFSEILAASRHGEELVDQTNRLCGDIVVAGTRRYLKVLARVIKEADGAGEISLASGDMTPEATASFLHMCAAGLGGPPAPSPAQYKRRIMQLARIVVSGLGGTAP